MKHLFSLVLGLMLLFAASIVPAMAGTFTGIEFPKIIYGDPTYCPDYNNSSSANYNLIDETGFNMILSDYNSNKLYVLSTSSNTHSIPVMFRLCKFPAISQYLFSTVIRRNIVEDGLYDMDDEFYRKYPGWSPRIRARGDPLTDAVNMFPYPTVACPDYIKGTSVRDYDLDPVHDVIMYNGGTSEDIIFTTMDTEQNHGGEHDFLFNQYLFAGYFDASKHPRNTYFRLRLKVDGASLPPEEAALTLTLDHTWHNGDYSICTTSPVTSQSKTITFGDIENITPTLDGYRWVTFKDVNTPYMVYFCQNETGNQQQAYDSQVDPQLTLTNKYEGACAIYVDSLEVWEEDAYKLIYLNQQSCIDDIEDDLEDLSQQTGISLLIGFDQDDVHPEWYATNAKIVFLINDYASLPSLWSSAQFHWGNKLRAANYPENNDIQYRWYGPDNEFWNIDLSDYMNAVSQQCTGFPDFQSAYTYPFGATASDIQNELDKLIGWYSDDIDTGRGLRYVYGNAQAHNAQPIYHLSSYQLNYGPSTSSQGTPGALRNRFPTKGELMAESYLTLAYGMRGLGYFLYYSSGNEPDLSYVGPGYENYTIGLFHRNVDNGPFYKTGALEGGINHNGFDTEGYQYCPADALQEFFADLDIITPCLNNLNWQAGGCYNSYSSQPIIGPVQAIAWMDSKTTDKFIEVTSFNVINANAIPAGEYFMVDNRDVEDNRSIFIALDETEPYFVEDLATHDIFDITEGIPGMGEGISVDIDAGKGRLFRLTNNYTWKGEVRISGDFSVPSGKTLNIDSGTIVRIYNNGTGASRTGGIVVDASHGNLNINGTELEPVHFVQGFHCKADEDNNEKWLGIRFNGVSMDNNNIGACEINNAQTGLSMVDVTSSNSVALSNIQFINCFDALYCEDSFLSQDLNLNNIYGNCTNNFIKVNNTQTQTSTFNLSNDADLYINVANSANSKVFNLSKTKFVVENCNQGTTGCDWIVYSENSDVSLTNYIKQGTCLKGIFFNCDVGSPKNLSLNNVDFSGIDFSAFYGISYGIIITNGNLNISNGSDISCFSWGIEALNSTIDISNSILQMSTAQQCGTHDMYGIKASNSILLADGLFMTGGNQRTPGEDNYYYAVYTENCPEIVIDNSMIETSMQGIYTLNSSGGLALQNTSIVGPNSTEVYNGVYVLNSNSASVSHYYGDNNTIDGFANGIYCQDCNVVTINEAKIADNSIFGIYMDNCSSLSLISYSTITNNGNDEYSGCYGGLYLYDTSPDIKSCYFTYNYGSAITALGGSVAVIGSTTGTEGEGNEFKENYVNEYDGIIYEAGFSYSFFDNSCNNFYLPDFDNFIYNTTQDYRRNIRRNFWSVDGGGTGTTPDGHLVPSQSYYWNWGTPPSSPYTIDTGQQMMMGGGSINEPSALEPSFILLDDLEYEAAVDSFKAVADNENGDLVDRLIALGYVLNASLEGELNLQSLLGYYQTFVAGSNSPNATFDEIELAKSARMLSAKVKQHMGNYNSAIMDYEEILTGNPTLEDSVFAVIEAGYSYLKKNNITPFGNGPSIGGSAGGSGISQGGSPNAFSPQMPELAPTNWAEFEENKKELIYLLVGGSAIAGNGEGLPALLLPAQFALHQNSPNPFNPETVIRYDLPELSNVRLEIFNVLGQKVCTLIDGWEPAGFKEVKWNGRSDQGGGVSSGLYIYKITAEGRDSCKKFVKSQKMMLLQ